jgi:hypothetical protein
LTRCARRCNQALRTAGGGISMLRSIKMGLLALLLSVAAVGGTQATTVVFSFTDTGVNGINDRFPGWGATLPGTVSGTLIGAGNWWWGFKANAVQFSSDVSAFGLTDQVYPLGCLYVGEFNCTLYIDPFTGTGSGSIYRFEVNGAGIVLDFGVEFVYVLWNVATGISSGDTIGRAQARFVLSDPEYVPLPAGLLLFASGLGVIGLLAKRRARRHA